MSAGDGAGEHGDHRGQGGVGELHATVTSSMASRCCVISAVLANVRSFSRPHCRHNRYTLRWRGPRPFGRVTIWPKTRTN